MKIRETSADRLVMETRPKWMSMVLWVLLVLSCGGYLYHTFFAQASPLLDLFS